MSTEKKKEQQLLEDVTAQPAVQSSYSTAGLNSRKEVENALTNAVYTPGQSVTNAAADLKNWQQNRPGKYESTYQGRIEDLIGQLLERNSFQYSYAQDPLYRQYAQQYTQNARNASADAAAQAAALTGGYGSSYAASVAQQAYQQQMGALNDALPSLYRLALDTYNSEGDDVVTRIDQLNTQEQNAQAQYNAELSDYYSQLDRKGSAYNAAYEQDYGRYQDYLGRLDTLYGYYSNQEQQAIAKRQQTFNNVLSILGVIGDAVQLAITGTTGIGSLMGTLANTGYNMYAKDRAYAAERADAAWDQQMQETQRQDSLAQQKYKNEQAERQYQDTLRQQEFNNNVTSEKLNIAKRHLLPRQIEEHGLAAKSVRISDKVMRSLIRGYTLEAGVRRLQRTIGKVVRKSAVEMIDENIETVTVTQETLEKFLGAPRFHYEKAGKKPEIGVVNGLAYTVVGGDTLQIETTTMPGTGVLELTGSLGDVMKESARAAKSYVRAHAVEFGIDPEFYKKLDIHIHVPEGAVPKDGPSAGVTMTTALVSALTGIAVRQNVAMTGEITLRGRVLPIGGLKEKLLAAHRAGIDTVLIPKENLKDLEEVPANVREALTIIPAEDVHTVLETALCEKPTPKQQA